MTTPTPAQAHVLQLVVDADGFLDNLPKDQALQDCTAAGWLLEEDGSYSLTLQGADALRKLQDAPTPERLAPLFNLKEHIAAPSPEADQ